MCGTKTEVTQDPTDLGWYCEACLAKLIDQLKRIIQLLAFLVIWIPFEKQHSGTKRRKLGQEETPWFGSYFSLFWLRSCCIEFPKTGSATRCWISYYGAPPSTDTFLFMHCNRLVKVKDGHTWKETELLSAWNAHPIPKWPPRMPPCGPVNPEGKA